MIEYKVGQRVRITKEQAESHGKTGMEGVIILLYPRIAGRYRVKLDALEYGIVLYDDEFEPVGALLSEERASTTINGKTWWLDDNQFGRHIRVDEDTTIPWTHLAKLGFTLNPSNN